MKGKGDEIKSKQASKWDRTLQSKLARKNEFPGFKALHSIIWSHLSDNVNAEIQALEIAHTKESTRHDLSNQITAQIDVFQRGESLQVDIFYGLEKKEGRRKKLVSNSK